MIRLMLLVASFVKIGILGFGGGYAMIPLIQREVYQFGISGGEFIDILALSQMTPGPIGINAATYTGYKVAGMPGATLATLSNVLPTFAAMLVAAHFFFALRVNRRVELFFKLARPLFIGLISSSALLMMRDIRIWQDYKACGIFLAVFVLLYRYRISFWLVFAVAGAAGLLFY